MRNNIPSYSDTMKTGVLTQCMTDRPSDTTATAYTTIAMYCVTLKNLTKKEMEIWSEKNNLNEIRFCKLCGELFTKRC